VSVGHPIGNPFAERGDVSSLCRPRDTRRKDTRQWIKEIERDIDRRLDAAIERGMLTPDEERLEHVDAPNGDRCYFSIRSALEARFESEVGEESQDPGGDDPA